MRYDSSVRFPEETYHFNFDNQKESKIENFKHKQKSIAKPVTERIGKKFDPYQYFKNECIQSHKNKAEDDIEKVSYSLLNYYHFYLYFLHLMKKNI